MQGLTGVLGSTLLSQVDLHQQHGMGNTHMPEQLGQLNGEFDRTRLGCRGEQHQIRAHRQVPQLLFVAAGLTIGDHHVGRTTSAERVALAAASTGTTAKGSSPRMP